MKSRFLRLVTESLRRPAVKERNSAAGHTYRQRSCPRVTTRPSASSSRNLAGRKRRPLSSRRGVWVPRNTMSHLSPATRNPPCYPLRSTLLHYPPPCDPHAPFSRRVPQVLGPSDSRLCRTTGFTPA